MVVSRVKVLWDFESVNFNSALLRSEGNFVREYLDRLDKWFLSRGERIDKNVYCSDANRRQFGELFVASGWTVVVAEDMTDNPIREEVNVFLWDGAEGRSLVLITNDRQYLTEIRNVKRHMQGSPSLVHTSQAPESLVHQAHERFDFWALCRPQRMIRPESGRIYLGRVRAVMKNALDVFLVPSMRRGRVYESGLPSGKTFGDFSEGEMIVVRVARAYKHGERDERYDLHVLSEMVPHETYTGVVRGKPLSDRFRVSIVRHFGWEGIVFSRPPLSGLPEGRSALEYSDGQEVNVELLASNHRGKVFRIIE